MIDDRLSYGMQYTIQRQEAKIACEQVPDTEEVPGK